MKFIVGQKKKMSQVFLEDGRVVPVTIVQAGPCVVTQVRTHDTDGYTAVQVGFGNKKKVGKSTAGHLKDLALVATTKEFRVDADQASSVARGQEITVSVFENGDVVKVTGTSKGKGYAGVVKRHGFSGQKATHGTKDQLRMPGSSGAGGPQRTFKGVRKPGQMGSEQVTVANLEVVKIDPELNLLYIKGALPGSKDSLVTITAPGEMTLTTAQEVVETPEVVEETTTQETTQDAPVEATVEAPQESQESSN